VKWKAVCKFACPFSNISEVNFVVIPVVKLLAIQLTIPDRNRDVMLADMKDGNHANSSWDEGLEGASGITMNNLTSMVTNPVKIAATKKGTG
jgi:hypothetical protein